MDSDIRVIHGGNQPEFAEQRTRTAAERHTETALKTAREHADAGLAGTEMALEWLESVGADIPSKFRTLPTVLRQLQTFIDDETARRL